MPSFLLWGVDVLILLAFSRRLCSHEMSHIDTLIFCIIYGLGAVLAEAIKIRLSPMFGLPTWAGPIAGIVIAMFCSGKAAAMVFGAPFQRAWRLGAAFLVLHFAAEYLLGLAFPAVV